MSTKPAILPYVIKQEGRADKTYQIFQQADNNGIEWIFPRQQYNNSCGPTCLRYAKLLFHGNAQAPSTYSLVPVKGEFSEGKARKKLAEFEPRKGPARTQRDELIQKAKEKYPEFKDPKDAIRKYLFDSTYDERVGGSFKRHDTWQASGTRPEMLLEALKSFPLPIQSARLVDRGYTQHLMKSSSRYPAIMGVQWTVQLPTTPGARLTDEVKEQAKKSLAGGGHFVCCVGPMKDGSNFIILDPMDGVTHLNSANVESDYIFYPNGKSVGRVHLNLSAKPAGPSDTSEGSLAEYLILRQFSSCGLIVTYPEG